MITEQTSTQVRRATQDDIPALLAMCRALHLESPRYRTCSFNQDKVEGTLQHLIGTLATGSNDDACVLIADRDGEVVGVFVGVIRQHLFSDDCAAHEVLFYIKPEHRGRTRAAVNLVRTFERWAHARGVAEKVVGTSTEITTATTLRLYEYLGYHSHGFAMIKRGP